MVDVWSAVIPTLLTPSLSSGLCTAIEYSLSDLFLRIRSTVSGDYFKKEMSTITYHLRKETTEICWRVVLKKID
jgi:hypothetical protein